MIQNIILKFINVFKYKTMNKYLNLEILFMFFRFLYFFNKKLFSSHKI